MNSIAERLRYAREKMGIGQVDAASKFGIPVSSYRKYESGPSEPGSEAMAGITRAGINVHWLLTGEGEMLRSDAQPRSAPSVTSTDFDRPRFLLAIEAVEEGLEAADRTMSPDKKAELFLAVYDLMEEPANTKARVLQRVRLAA